MKIKELKKEFGSGIQVSRDRRARTVTASACGLKYHADERRFKNEREMAEHLKSKLPAVVVGAQIW